MPKDTSNRVQRKRYPRYHTGSIEDGGLPTTTTATRTTTTKTTSTSTAWARISRGVPSPVDICTPLASRLQALYSTSRSAARTLLTSTSQTIGGVVHTCRDKWQSAAPENLERGVGDGIEAEGLENTFPRRSTTTTAGTLDVLLQYYTATMSKVRGLLHSQSHLLRPRTLLLLIVLLLTIISIGTSIHWASVNAMSVLLGGDTLLQQTQLEALERVTRQRDVEERVGRVYETTSILAPCDPFGKSPYSVTSPSSRHQKNDNDEVMNVMDQLFHTGGAQQPLSEAIRQWGGFDSEDLATNPLALCRHFIHIHHVSIGDETVTGGRFRNPPPAHLHDIAPHTTGTNPPLIQPGEDGGIKAVIGGDQLQQNQHHPIDAEVEKAKEPWYRLGLVGRDLSGSANPQTDILERIAPVAPVVVEHAAHLLPSPGSMNLKRRTTTTSARSSSSNKNNNTSGNSGSQRGPSNSNNNNNNVQHTNYIAQLAVPPFSGDVERIAGMGIGAYLLFGENGAAPSSSSNQQQQSTRSPLAGGMENVILAMLGKPVVSLWYQIAAPFLRQHNHHHGTDASTTSSSSSTFTHDTVDNDATASITSFSLKKKNKKKKRQHYGGVATTSTHSSTPSSYPLSPRHHHQYLATVTTHTIDLPYHSTGRILYRLKRDQLPYFNVYVRTNPLNNHPTLAIADNEPVDHWLAQEERDSEKHPSTTTTTSRRFGLAKGAEEGLAKLTALPPKLDAHSVLSISPSSTLAPFYPEHPYHNALVDPSPWVEDNAAKRNHYFGSSKFQNFGNPVDILREQLQRQSDLLTAGGTMLRSSPPITTTNNDVAVASNSKNNNSNNNMCWVTMLSPGPVSTPFLFSFEEFNSQFWGSSYFQSNRHHEWIPPGRTSSGFVQGGFSAHTGIIPFCAADASQNQFSPPDELNKANGDVDNVIDNNAITNALHDHRLRIGSLQSGHGMDTKAMNRISNAGVQGNNPTTQANARAHLAQENNMYVNVFSVTENVVRVINRRLGVKPAPPSPPSTTASPQQIAALPSVTLKPPSPTLGGWDKVRKSIFTVFDARAKLWSDQLAQYLVEATTAAEELSEIMAPLHEQESHEYVRSSSRHKKAKALSDGARGAIAVALNKFISKKIGIGSKGSAAASGSSSSSSGGAGATSSTPSPQQQQQQGSAVIVNTLNHFVITCSASAGLHDALRERYFFETGGAKKNRKQPRVQLAEERLARIHSHCMGFYLDRLRTLAEVDAPKHIFSYLSAIADNPQFETNIPTYPGIEKWMLANKLEVAGVTKGNLSGASSSSSSITAEQYLSARHLITSNDVTNGIKMGYINPSYAEQHRVYLPMHVDVLRRLSGFQLGDDGKVKFTSASSSNGRSNVDDGKVQQQQKMVLPIALDKETTTPTTGIKERYTGESRSWISTFERTLARLKGRTVHVFADRIPLFAGQLLSSSGAPAGGGNKNNNNTHQQLLSVNNPNNDDPFLVYPDSLDDAPPTVSPSWYGRILSVVGLGGGGSSSTSSRPLNADDIVTRRKQLKKRIQLALRAEEAAEGRASLLTLTQRQLLIHHYSIPVVRSTNNNNNKGGKTSSSTTTTTTPLSEDQIVQRMLYFCKRHFVHIRFSIPKLFFKESTDNEDNIPSALTRKERLEVYDRWLADKTGIRVHVVAMPSGPSGAALNPSTGLYQHVIGPALRASGFNLHSNEPTTSTSSKNKDDLSKSKGIKQNVAHGEHRNGDGGDDDTTTKRSAPTTPPPTTSETTELLSTKRRLLQAEEDPPLPQQPGAAVAQAGGDNPEEGGAHRHQAEGVENQGVGASYAGAAGGVGRITPSPEEEARVRKEQDSHVSHEHHEASQYLREVGASMPYCALRDHLDEELTSAHNKHYPKQQVHNKQKQKHHYSLMWERVQQFMRTLGSDSESLRGRILHHINAELRTSPMTWGPLPTPSTTTTKTTPLLPPATTPLTNFKLFGAPVAVSVVGTSTRNNNDGGALRPFVGQDGGNDEDPLVVECLSKASHYTPYLSTKANTSALGYIPEYQPDQRYKASLKREVMDTSEWLWSDCIHPSHSGHRLVALSTLQQLLESSTGVVRKHINQKP